MLGQSFHFTRKIGFTPLLIIQMAYFNVKIPLTTKFVGVYTTGDFTFLWENAKFLTAI